MVTDTSHDMRISWQTERLSLRLVTYADTSDIFAYSQDPQVSTFLPWKPHASLEKTQQVITRWLEDRSPDAPTVWAIVHTESKRVIGTVEIDPYAYENKKSCVYLSYCLSPAYWGNGLMSEAIQSVAAYLFKETEVIELVAFIQGENISSERVVHKIDMCMEPGRAKRNFIKGKWANFNCWVLCKYAVR